MSIAEEAISESQTRGQLLEQLLIQYKQRIEKGECEPYLGSGVLKTQPIDPAALATLIVGAAVILNLQNIGLAILKEQIWLRLATTGQIDKMEAEASKIIKPFTA